MIDEKALFQEVAKGDREAFRQLFHHYNRILQPFVLRLTGSPVATQEVVQEVFLKLWVHRDRLTDVENPKAYIVRIVNNEAINFLRGQARDNRLREAVGQLGVEEVPSPEQGIFYREMESRINEAIERLPQSCRKIYRMSREQYMRIPEIADALNLSDSTVKNQLVKALKSIRLHLNKVTPTIIFLILLSATGAQATIERSEDCDRGGARNDAPTKAQSLAVFSTGGIFTITRPAKILFLRS